MDQFKFERFIPLSKVDEEKRMVYGFASTPDLDSDGEVIKLEALEKALPEYLNFPTIREMHQPKAAGTTIQADIKDKGAQQGLYIGAKIVSDEAWKLVKEKVYRGFSIGGNIIRRTGNVISDLELVEISLVDVPANKKAKIEVWKRAKGDIQKDANMVYSMANLMMHVKDMMGYCEYAGKDTKKLGKILEMIKEMVAEEASEPEAMKEKAAAISYLKSRIELLNNMDFADNKAGDFIRKEVIHAMSEKLETIKKNDEGAEPEKKPEVESAKPNPPADGEPEKPAADDTAKGADATLAKLQEIDQKLTKLDPSGTPEAQNLTKTVKVMASSIAKVVSILETLEGRVATLEKTPAAPKSRSAFVSKTILTGQGGAADPDNKNNVESEELKTKKARLTELNKIYDQIGKADFARRGFSLEAQRLENEIASMK